MNFNKINVINPYVIAFVIFAFFNILIGNLAILSEGIIGRYIDFNVPSVPSSIKNTIIFNIYTWFDNYNNGMRGGFSATILPQQIILNLPLILTDSPWIISRWQVLLPFAFSIFNFIFLFRVINSDKKYTWISIIFAYSFTYNNYTFSELSYGSMNILISYAFMPLTIALYIKFTNTSNLKYFVLSLFALIISGGILQHLVLILLIIIFIGSYNKSYKNLIYYILSFVLLSLYWILPLLLSIYDIQDVELKSVFRIDSFNLSNIFEHRMYLAIGGRIAYETLIENELVTKLYWINAIIFTLLPFIIIYNYEIDNNKIKILCLGIIVLLFLMKGTAEPFGKLNNFLYENIPGMILFRTVNRFYAGYMILNAVLLCYLITLIKFNKNFIIFLAFNFLLLMLPLFFTDSYGLREFEKNKQIGGLNLYINNEYDTNFYKILNNGIEGKIITNPPTYSGRFTIGNYLNRESQGGDPSLLYSERGFFVSDGPTGKLKKLIDYLELDMYTNPNFLIDNFDILSTLGIKYFVVRKNLKPEHSINAKFFNNRIIYNLDNRIKLEYSDQVNIVYSLNKNRNLFYIPKNIDDIKFINSLSKRYVDINLSDEKDSMIWSFSQFLYKKINPTCYDLMILGASGNLPLYLNLNKNSAWIAIDYWYNFSKKVTGIESYTGAFNSNKWVIDIEKYCFENNLCSINKDGTYNLRLQILFKTQIYFYIGLILSMIFLSFLLLMLYIKKNYNK